MSLYLYDLSIHNDDSLAGASDINGVILKATEGYGYTDKSCDTKYQIARNAGKLIGVYHFARPDLNPNDVIAEADWFLDQTKGYWYEAILCLDWEAGDTTNVLWAKFWLDRVFEVTGVKPLIYMSASVLKKADWSMVVNAGYGLWIAGYPAKYNVSNPPRTDGSDIPYDITPWQYLAIWQYSSSLGALDRNIAYMDVTGWHKYAGVKPETTTTTTTLDQPTTTTTTTEVATTTTTTTSLPPTDPTTTTTTTVPNPTDQGIVINFFIAIYNFIKNRFK